MCLFIICTIFRNKQEQTFDWSQSRKVGKFSPFLPTSRTPLPREKFAAGKNWPIQKCSPDAKDDGEVRPAFIQPKRKRFNWFRIYFQNTWSEQCKLAVQMQWTISWEKTNKGVYQRRGGGHVTFGSQLCCVDIWNDDNSNATCVDRWVKAARPKLPCFPRNIFKESVSPETSSKNLFPGVVWCGRITRGDLPVQYNNDWPL